MNHLRDFDRGHFVEHFCEFIIWTNGSGDAVLRYFLICNSGGHLVEQSGPVWAI